MNNYVIKTDRLELREICEADTELPDDEFLERIGAASDDSKDKKMHPTCAGLLMFGLEHKITREYPKVCFNIRNNNGTCRIF